MKKLKKPISLLLGVLLAALLPLSLTADLAMPEVSAVCVAGTEITAGGYWLATYSNGNSVLTPGDENGYNVHYNAATGVLTLKDAVIPTSDPSGPAGAGIHVVNKALTIILEGANQIINSFSQDDNYAIFADSRSPLTISSPTDGSLYLEAQGGYENCGIFAGKGLTVTGGDIVILITANRFSTSVQNIAEGIRVENGDLEIRDGNIQLGAELIGDALKADSYALGIGCYSNGTDASFGNLNITGGSLSVTVYSSDNYSCRGITAEGCITVSGGTTSVTLPTANLGIGVWLSNLYEGNHQRERFTLGGSACFTVAAQHNAIMQGEAEGYRIATDYPRGYFYRIGLDFFTPYEFTDSAVSPFSYEYGYKLLDFMPKRYAATPTFSPDGGNYTAEQRVTVSCETEGAQIRYTLDGSEPSMSSPLYTGPITVSPTATLKAKAFKNGIYDSDTAVAAYTKAVPEPTEYHTIYTSVVGQGGISPDGRVNVADGGKASFTLTPAEGCHVADLLLDGVSVKERLEGDKFTLEAVERSGFLKAVFERNETPASSAATSAASSPPAVESNPTSAAPDTGGTAASAIIPAAVGISALCLFAAIRKRKISAR